MTFPVGLPDDQSMLRSGSGCSSADASGSRPLVASHSTRAVSALRSASASAARQARRVAPVVTTSSTSRTVAPARRQRGRPHAQPPGEVLRALHCVQPHRVAAPGRRAAARGRPHLRHLAGRRPRGQRPAQPHHVVAPAGARGGRTRRRRHQPDRRRAGGRPEGPLERPREQRGERPASSRRPRSLYASSAARSGPLYRPAASTGSARVDRPGSRRAAGGPRQAAQARHHGVPGAAQPPHAWGRTSSVSAARSRRSAIASPRSARGTRQSRPSVHTQARHFSLWTSRLALLRR